MLIALPALFLATVRAVGKRVGGLGAQPPGICADERVASRARNTPHSESGAATPRQLSSFTAREAALRVRMPPRQWPGVFRAAGGVLRARRGERLREGGRRVFRAAGGVLRARRRKWTGGRRKT